MTDLFITLFYIFLVCFTSVSNTNEQATEEIDKSKYILEINNSSKPEVKTVILEDENGGNIIDNVSISDVYNVDVLASGVVGLVGVPVRLDFYEKLNSEKLTFIYDENELRGIPEENLIILHYDKNQEFYVQVEEEDVNLKENTVSINIEEDGIYLLADKYDWYTVWGMDMSEFAYDKNKSDYISDWERECDIGDILEIADIDWAMENSPYFNVSTKEQLAGVVYYANAINDPYNQLFLTLEKDIDLDGISWVPMGWLGSGNNSFNGVIDGQGHTIKNMHIKTEYFNHAAFIAYSTGLEVKDINFEDAYVVGGTYTGIVGGEIYSTKEWTNVNVSGYIEGSGKEIGAIIGREAYINFKNCSADVYTVNSNRKKVRIEYFSHRQEVLENTPVTEDFTLKVNKDGSVSRTEQEGFRNLCWHIENNGQLLLQRNAENELELPAEYAYSGSTIWLEAYTGETYTRVSNIVTIK